MTDALDRERRKNLSLALALSAGLHLIAIMTLDLSPGSWRHGVAPALRVVLKQAPGEAPASESRPAPKTEESGIAATTPQSGSSLPTAVRYYRNSEVDVPATPIVRGPLIFPEHAYVSKLRGTVKARVYINEDGAVESVQIVEVRPLGGIFEEAALEALRQVRYKPAEIAGQPVKTQKLIEVTFNPYEEQAPAAR